MLFKWKGICFFSYYFLWVCVLFLLFISALFVPAVKKQCLKEHSGQKTSCRISSLSNNTWCRIVQKDFRCCEDSYSYWINMLGNNAWISLLLIKITTVSLVFQADIIIIRYHWYLLRMHMIIYLPDFEI